MVEKRGARLELAFHECRLDEDVAREPRIDRAERDTPIEIYRHAVERAPLQGDHLAAAPVPVRVAALAPNKVRAQVFQPLRIDAGNATREKARGFDQLRGDQPLARLL